MKTVREFVVPVNDYDPNLEKEKRYVPGRERVFRPGFYPYVQEVVRFNLLSVNAGDPVEKALQIMFREKVKTLPVLEKGKIVGVVRSRDLIALYGELFEDKRMSFSS
ncbi:MAG: CBS domain-containing protein [Bacillota bacterium]